MPPGSFRLIFGTNIDGASAFPGSGRPLPEAARRHFLSRSGLSLQHAGDLKAVLAQEAIAKGVIEIRIFDSARSSAALGRYRSVHHAKAYVGERAAIIGSANLTRPGLGSNIELADRVGSGSEAYAARRAAVERFWEAGKDWRDEALAILSRLLRLTSPEEAAARAASDMTGFAPWRVDGDTARIGRPPQEFQAELVYEAAGTIYEHGFAFVECPTGSGKTDIGKHLASILTRMHAKVVWAPPAFGGNSLPAAASARQGRFAIVPSKVHENWSRRCGSGLPLVRYSTFSKDLARNPELAEELGRRFRSAAAVVVDECHQMNSRWLGDSMRSRNFEDSPAIWAACLSATLLGNHGLDSLLAFHEKRASIYMARSFTDEINALLADLRRTELRGPDLFGEPAEPALRSSRERRGVEQKPRQGLEGGQEARPNVAATQRQLASVLAPRSCAEGSAPASGKARTGPALSTRPSTPTGSTRNSGPSGRRSSGRSAR
jgi:hypothetical protein